VTRGKFDSIFVPALCGLVGLYLSIFIYYVKATIITVPYLDLLEYIVRYNQYWLTGDWWHYLWLPQNEHRPIWSLLLVLADIGWFRGTTLPFLVFDSACFLLSVGGLVWVIWTSTLDTNLRVILGTAVILLLAASYCVIYCSLPIEGIYAHTTGLFVLSLVLFDGAGVTKAKTALRRAAGLAISVFAAFGINGGLLAPLMLLWLAWVAGYSRVWLITIGLTASILFAVFLPGVPAGQVSNSLDQMALASMVDYFIGLLGLPWSHVPSITWVGRLIGGVVLGCSFVTLARGGIMHRPGSRLERVGIALLLFSLLISVMIAVGRWDLLTERPAPVRYTLFTVLAEAGLLLANTPLVLRLWQKGYQRPFEWATLAAAMILLVQQVIAGQAAVAVTNQYKKSYRQFAAGQWTMVTSRPVFPNGTVADKEKVLKIIHHLGIYQN
jgi:hypothetical protein